MQDDRQTHRAGLLEVDHLAVEAHAIGHVDVYDVRLPVPQNPLQKVLLATGHLGDFLQLAALADGGEVANLQPLHRFGLDEGTGQSSDATLCFQVWANHGDAHRLLLETTP